MNNKSRSEIDSIVASGDIAGGSIITSNGNISSLSGNIQTTQGTVGVKNKVFQKSHMRWNENSNGVRF